MKNIHQIRSEVECRLQAETGKDELSVLARAITPALYLHPTPDPQQMRSHRGGQPQSVKVWPGFRNVPMLFLLALRLSEVWPFDQDGTLPREGWLNFFIASEVVEGMAPLDACAVIYNSDETEYILPPVQGLCFEREGLTFEQGIHSVPQAYECGDSDQYDTAFAEFEALGFNLLSEEVENIQDGDYLLGKQIYATAAGVESTHDISAFTEQRDGHQHARLQALLTLRSDAGHWPFFHNNSLMSLTFFIEAGDLKAHRFERVIVDITSD